METPEPKTEELSAPEPAAESKPAKPEHQETVWDTLRSLLIVLVGVLCIRTFVAEATVIPTGFDGVDHPDRRPRFPEQAALRSALALHFACACRRSEKFIGWILWRFVILAILPLCSSSA